ncbi:MAG: hypothetical protein ACI4AM_01700 [Muribaculaceae bacterium]
MLNYLSVSIASRMKKLFKQTKLSDQYSFKRLMGYFSKIKRVRVGEDGNCVKSPTRSNVR